ncbi:MAG: hypothetical protein Q4Q04_03705 [Methanocorpusculum sp.]|nr:hypothetical protein [Methanocorpusculum sp.]
MKSNHFDDAEVIPDMHMKMRRAKAMKMNRILAVIIVVLAAVLAALFIATIGIPLAVDFAEQKAAEQKAAVWVPDDWVGTLQTNSSSTTYFHTTSGDTGDHIVDTRVYNPAQPEGEEFQQKIVKKEGKYMLVVYEESIEFPQNASERSSSLVLTDVHPVTTLTLAYSVPNVTVHKSVKTGSHMEGGRYFDDYKEFDVTYPNPDARLVVKVYADDGTLYSEEGYGGMFDIGTTDTIKFLRPGNYSVEIVGREIEFSLAVAIW